VNTLLLWDIDGTLIASGHAGMHALQTGLRNAFGLDGALDDIDFAGRTDRWIARRIFAKFSLPDTEESFTRLIDGYLAALPAALCNPRARVLPGVRALLATAAARPDLAQGLLTGNLRRGAQTKLGHHGLWDFFPFGGFADDAELRNDISPHALRRAQDHTRTTFDPARVWVIGDTPHDIACARVIGARALAVATGSHTIAQLAAHAPDAVLPDLADPDTFWKTIG
jgi:phosphoglycolate phosphatase-like HAD superfamily hydrolase